MGAGWCTREDCDIIELHDAHPEDFEKERGQGKRGPDLLPRGRHDPRREGLSRVAKAKRDAQRGRTRAELKVALQPKVVRREMRPDGPFAYVECPECRGGGCAECQETGEMSLFRWHLWSRRC